MTKSNIELCVGQPAPPPIPCLSIKAKNEVQQDGISFQTIIGHRGIRVVFY